MRFSFIDSRKDFCSECGQFHSADEDTNDESDNEICPDCGVPHNPFRHPPSPSSKVSLASISIPPFFIWTGLISHCDPVHVNFLMSFILINSPLLIMIYC